MKYIAVLAAALLVGCDHPDSWEYSVYGPKDATHEQLLGIENALRSNGYKRVYIRTIDFGRATLIQATRTEGGAK